MRKENRKMLSPLPSFLTHTTTFLAYSKDYMFASRPSYIRYIIIMSFF